MQVLILCGGLGTRAYPYTDHIPKPMLPVDGAPILMHVMKIFAEQGYRDFVLALGHRKEVIMDYFEGKELGWNVRLVDTGDETLTGGRILRCREHLQGKFIATYSDGLAAIPLDDLVAFHDSHSGLATITAVPMPCQYGTIDFDDSGRVRAFREKPTLHDHWINAGFLVFDPEVFSVWEGENLETDVLPALARGGQLYTFKYPGRFKSMDSYKDQRELEELVRSGNTFWRG
ncbi:MAG: NTP transferase domain-containing protein [Proteobacteria bacterium]|nr:NTP transferase domain-containing protein [Pseudomonadota bacterium]